MIDLFNTLNELHARQISLISQTGLEFDLGTPQGKLVATLMTGFAEFEMDLLRERVRSGVKAAQARGVVFGRRPGQRIKSDRLVPKVLALAAAGQSYRQTGRQLDLSKNTVLGIVKGERVKAK
jgi:putative DNA-invertase from lambdoid prophage Rac